MTELLDRLYNSSKNPARLAVDLLQHYSFELAGYAVVQQIEIWLEYYPSEWLPLALIEALYQGRYKAISVEQILNLWQRREHPVYHFNHEFERLICGNLPQVAPSLTLDQPPTVLPQPPQPALSYRKMLLELPSLQASRLERLSEIPPFKLVLSRSEAIASPTRDTSPPPISEPVLPVVQNHHANEEPQPLPVALTPTHEASNAELDDEGFEEFKGSVIFGLSSGLAIAALKPRFKLELCHYYKPNWLAFLELEPDAIPNNSSTGAAFGQ